MRAAIAGTGSAAAASALHRHRSRRKNPLHHNAHNHVHPAPLLALDWVQIAILLFIVVSSLAGQLFKTNQERQRKAGGRPAGPQPAAPQARSPQTQIVRAARCRKKSKTSCGVPPVSRRTKRRSCRPKSSPIAPRRTSRVPPLAAAPTGRRGLAARDRGGARRAPTAACERGLEQRDAHLGSLIEQTDERMESRLERRFDHTLGQLARPLHRQQIPPRPSNHVRKSRRTDVIGRRADTRDLFGRRACAVTEFASRRSPTPSY